MSSIDDFLMAPSASLPSMPTGGRSKSKPQGIGARLAPIIDSLSEMEPYSREFARQLYNGTFKDAGINIEIPDPDEFAARKLSAEHDNMKLRRELAGEKVELAQAMLADLDPGQRLQMRIPSSDNLLDEDPDRFITVAQQLGVDLRKSDLILAGLGDSLEDIQAKGKESKAKKETESLSRQASQLGSMEKIAKYEGVFDDPAKQAVQDAEKAYDVDLFTFDTDTDEVAGARALFSAYEQLMKRTTQDLRPKAVESFLKLKGSDIADAMEEAELDPTNGSLLFGTGTGDADPDAIYFLGALVNRMARDSSNSASTIMQRLGLKATQLDKSTAEAMTKALAQKLDEDPNKIVDAFWAPGRY